MNESKANRILKLEQHKTASDLKKDYCSCHCHNKNILDFMEIPDKKIIALAEIVGRMAPSYAEDLEERIKNRPPCTCTH